MKQSRIKDYSPKYPKKLWRGTSIAAAALMSIGAAGCIRVQKKAAPLDQPVNEQPPATEQPEEITLSGDVEYVIPDDLMQMGESSIEDDPTMLGGEPLPDDTYDEEDPEGGRFEEPALMGKIAVFENPDEP